MQIYNLQLKEKLNTIREENESKISASCNCNVENEQNKTKKSEKKEKNSSENLDEIEVRFELDKMKVANELFGESHESSGEKKGY